jgi:excisionase family DNA binding protein
MNLKNPPRLSPVRTRAYSPLLTISQAAWVLGASCWTVQRMIADRAIPFYRLGHSFRIELRAVEQFIYRAED